MQFKHSLSIFSCNLSLSYKSLLFIFVVLILAAALFVGLIAPVVEGINEALTLEGVPFSFKIIARDPVDTLETIWNTTMNYLSSNRALVVSRIFYFCLLLIFIRFFISLIFVPITKLLYEKMTAGLAGNLLPNFIASLPQALLMSLISSIFYTIIDIFLVFLSFQVFFLIYKIMKVTAIIVALAIFIALYSARISLFSQWLPLIADGERNVFTALKRSFRLSLKVFYTYYPAILTLNVLYSALLLTSIMTLGIITVVTFPMFIIINCSLNLTCYFNIKKKKYYIDNGETVYTPKD